MANVENLEKRLIDLIDEESSFAIALTGEWGIGKTYFWKEFYKKNHTNLEVNKYSYVSLFGIDSIDALKFEIALSTHETTQKKDYLSGLKGIFKKSLDAIDLPKLEGTGVTLSLGKGLISSAITSLIGDTLICIDDIERLSKNLDIKDVMGLVNHLSLEKNCKVVVILHEGKADKDFREYKEKVFDEVLVLDDSLLIIEDLISDIEIFPIYEKFYQTMGVRNLRFYQRVQKIYTLIIESHELLTYTSKKQILKSILVLRMAYDMPSVFEVDIDFHLFVKIFDERRVSDYRDYNLPKQDIGIDLTKKDQSIIDEARKRKEISKQLKPFNEFFIISDWSRVIVNLLIDLTIDTDTIKKLIETDKFSEKQLINDREKQGLMTEYHSLAPKDDFNERLFDNLKERINIDKETLNNLSFHCNTLHQNGKVELSNQLESLVKDYIKIKVDESSVYWSMQKWYFINVDSYDIFHGFLEQTINNRKTELGSKNDINSNSEKLYQSCQRGSPVEDESETIFSITKSDIRNLIWREIDDELDRRSHIIHVIRCLQSKITTIKSSTDNDEVKINKKADEIKKWINNILEERIEEYPNSKAAVKNILDSVGNS